MLGEKLGEGKGKVTSKRVLPSAGPQVTIEVSFQSQGTILGLQCTENVTYTATTRPDGTLYGEGQGVLMGANGETATWKGQGIGRFAADGTAQWRGAVYYTASSQKLSRLNSVVGVFEHSIDKDGNATEQVFEWR